MKVREMDIEFYRQYMANLEGNNWPKWQYNEMKPCGVNYNSIAAAWFYDRRHMKFRDYKAESEQIIAALGLKRDATVIDIGCGTGAFAIYAAGHYRKVYAVDVSNSMLRSTRKKARKANLNNIEFHNGGFLTYEHRAEPADAIVSSVVLHHLPDFWKQVGLNRMAAMLKPGGKLYLFDVVFSFDIADYKRCLDEFVKSAGKNVGPEFAAEAEIHAREEYSTFDWIMEEMLKKAGFKIENKDYKDGFLATYLCTKVSEV